MQKSRDSRAFPKIIFITMSCLEISFFRLNEQDNTYDNSTCQTEGLLG